MTETKTEDRPLRIDLVSDVVCPWCSVGYQRLQTALQDFPDLKVELNFQPFELNPNMPSEGQNVTEHIAEKYGSDLEAIEQNRAHLRAVGEAEGITFSMANDARIYNTFQAHKLLHKAQQLGTQKALKLALMEAYFAGHQDVSSEEVLVEIACANGFTEAMARDTLADETISRQVRAIEQQYTAMGISAVPTFIFNQQFSVSGAHDAATLAGVIKDISNR